MQRPHHRAADAQRQTRQRGQIRERAQGARRVHQRQQGETALRGGGKLCRVRWGRGPVHPRLAIRRGLPGD